MSPRRFPTFAAAIPRTSASRVTAMSFSACGEILPTGTVIAASACHPSTIAPASMPTMSPSLSLRLLGMPWTICSFTEVQIVAGYP